MNQFKIIEGLGEIPIDWDVEKADSLCSKITKGTTPPKSEIVETREIPFLRVNNLSFDGKLDLSSSFIFVSKKAHQSLLARSVAYENDILMNIVGPPLGKTALLGNDFKEYNLNQAIIIYRVTSNIVDRSYFFSFLKSSIAQNWLESHSKKTSGQQNLTIEVCKNLPIPLPPFSEQRIIASILTTWDEAINNTEQLLANSQQRKKALMQQLLMGKVRFNGFDEEWEAHSLKKISSIVKGSQLNKNTLSKSGLYPVINGGITPSGYTENYNTESDTITISEGGNSCGFVSYIKVNFWCGGHCYALKDLKLDKNYLFHFLKFKQNDIMALRVGSGLPNIQKKAIEDFTIDYPSLKEQQKIAAVLSTADDEITNILAQLNRLRLEKKALMQQLLTGKVRVKVEESA